MFLSGLRLSALYMHSKNEIYKELNKILQQEHPMITQPNQCVFFLGKANGISFWPQGTFFPKFTSFTVK